MTLDPNTTLADAWADDKARLEALRTMVQDLIDTVAADRPNYVDVQAMNAASNVSGDLTMKLENIDRAIEHLDSLIP